MVVTMTLVLSALCLTQAAPTGNITTGNVTGVPCQAGIFTAGDNATINCIFTQDIAESLHHVFVTKYLHHTGGNYTDVIVCIRLRNLTFFCKENEGYEFRGIMKTNFTIEIPRVTTQFAGWYFCSLVPPDHVPQATCLLDVQEPVQQTTKDYNGQEEEVPSTAGDEKYSSLVVALVVVSIFAGTALPLCLVWNMRHTIRKCLKCERQGQQSGSKANPSELAPLQATDTNDYVDIDPVRFPSETEEADPSMPLFSADSSYQYTEFNEWAEGLTPQAKELLHDAGYDNLLSLRHATDEDIKALGLKKGHEKVVLEKLRTLPPEEQMPPRRRPQENVDSVKNTPSPGTLTTRDETRDAPEQEEGDKTVSGISTKDDTKTVPRVTEEPPKRTSSEDKAEMKLPIPVDTNTGKYIRGIVSVTRRDDGGIILKLMDGSYLCLESSSCSVIIYTDTCQKHTMLDRKSLSAQEEEHLREMLYKFEQDERRNTVSNRISPRHQSPSIMKEPKIAPDLK